ncbi:MAG: SBBP repeat-containing protein [Bacteroidota bacterium]
MLISKQKWIFYLLTCSAGVYLSAQGPALDWATYIGGSEFDDARAIAVDESGFIYATGTTEGVLPNISADAHQSNPQGGKDAYLAKYAPEGSLVWATYLGGEDTDEAKSLAVSPSGEVLVMITTSSLTQLATTGVYQPEFGGGFTDAYLAKFSSDGQMIWGTYLGGDNNDIGFDITTDVAGNAYVVGRTKSFNNIASDGAFQTGIAGDIDAFIFKIDADGQRVWSTYFGGNRVDLGTAVTVDPQQNVYLGGWTASEDNIATGGQQPIYGGGQADMFLAKFRANGQRQWCTYFGGVNNDFANDLAYQSDGALVMVGSSFSPENIGTPGTHQPFSDGSGEAVIAKFDLQGQQLWGSYFGGEEPDVFSELNIDPAGNLYVSGYAKSTDAISTVCSPQDTHGQGIWDATLSVFSASGRLKWSTYLGSTEEEQAYDIVMSPGEDAVYLTGITKSTDHFSTGQAQQSEFGGGDSDGFLARYDLCRPPVAQLLDGGSICEETPDSLVIDLLEGPCATLQYAIDGEVQDQVILQSGRNAFYISTPNWQRIDVLSLGNSDCPGEVLGPNYMELVNEILSTSEVILQCDSTTQTYTASFRLYGRTSSYLELDNRGSFNDRLFTSNPIPFGQPYSFRVSSTAGCEILILNGQFACSEDCAPLQFNLESNYQSCIGDGFQLGPFLGEDFRWSGPNTFQSDADQLLISALDDSNAGTYQLVVTYGVVCADSFAFDLELADKPELSWQFIREPDCQLETADIELYADQVDLLFAVDGRSYQDFSYFSGLSPGEHSITAINELGCTTTSTISWTPPLCPVYAPTAFSPNDDGINDRFRLFAARELNIQVERFEIFDRWGGSITRTIDLPLDDPSGWWNGNMPDGRPATMGSYVWVAELITQDGQKISQSGVVNLLR